MKRLTTGPEHPNSLNRQWRREYDAKRYMEHLTLDELNRRAADLMTNLWTLTPKGQIGCREIQGEGFELWRKWTHVAEEFQLRFGPYPAGFSKETLAGFQDPKPTFPIAPPGYLALSSAELDEKRPFLLKLGKRPHIEAMFEAGTVRISPASHFRDPSLNAAMHDDELSFESIAPPDYEFKVSTLPGGPFVPVGGLETIRLKSTMRTDFYVYCMTHAADHRLFDDFGADGCVAIIKPKEFLERLVAAVKQVLPNWKFAGGRVRYVDPHFVNAHKLTIPMTKHFRYGYQRESRVYWMPPVPRADLQPFIVHLGSLRDCASLIVLPSSVEPPSVAT